MIPTFFPTKAKRLIITPLIGAGTAVIYVLCSTAGAVTAKTANNFVTEIGPASATVPGTPFRLDNIQSGYPPIMVDEYQIDGAHTGDTVQVAWELP